MKLPHVVRTTGCICSLLLSTVCSLSAANITWNVNTHLNVDLNNATPGIATAIQSAKDHFTTNPDDQIILFNHGTYYFTSDEPAFEVTDLQAGANGRSYLKDEEE